MKLNFENCGKNKTPKEFWSNSANVKIFNVQSRLRYIKQNPKFIYVQNICLWYT